MAHSRTAACLLPSHALYPSTILSLASCDPQTVVWLDGSLRPASSYRNTPQTIPQQSSYHILSADNLSQRFPQEICLIPRWNAGHRSRGACISHPGSAARTSDVVLDPLTPHSADLCAAQLTLECLVDSFLLASIEDRNLKHLQWTPSFLNSLAVHGIAATSRLE